MPKKNAGKVTKTLHPNSRKAKKRCKLACRDMKLENQKSERKKKIQILGEKLMWFHSNMDPEKTCYSCTEMDALVQKYLGRFDDEFKQIAEARSIGNRRDRHNARVETLRFILDRDRREYCSVGLELPNLLDAEQFQTFRKWNGEMRVYHNIAMVMFCNDGGGARERRAVVDPKVTRRHMTLDECDDEPVACLGDSDVFVGMSADDSISHEMTADHSREVTRGESGHTGEVVSDGGESESDPSIDDHAN